jgi:hypothetical protein
MDTMVKVPRFLMNFAFVCIVPPALSAFAQIQTRWRGLDGRVIDENGAGVAGALVVASGAGFDGWTSTGPDGYFHLKAAGRFISVRHAGLAARLLRTSELTEPVRIALESAGESVRKMPSCDSSPGVHGKWIGGGLRVNPGPRSYKGPVNGEHDSHWYLKAGQDTLHIVHGYAWHSGLPLEEQLASSQNISVGSWEIDNIVGLDLSGTGKDGKRWRWLGAPTADAIEYTDAAQEAANYFDRIIESACFESVWSKN